eukprot:TRINITY_DN21092_c0_g1_i1.p1 TRINITY_DN21092_c0_g1~~TRINITY_DN21092_c0_g1_i1.p1  ORF type:complete len:297 (+),score=55.64 TRINITY_DN21092_c0_g1_i1:86-976(+)
MLTHQCAALGVQLQRPAMAAASVARVPLARARCRGSRGHCGLPAAAAAAGGRLAAAAASRSFDLASFRSLQRPRRALATSAFSTTPRGAEVERLRVRAEVENFGRLAGGILARMRESEGSGLYYLDAAGDAAVSNAAKAIALANALAEREARELREKSGGASSSSASSAAAVGFDVRMGSFDDGSPGAETRKLVSTSQPIPGALRESAAAPQKTPLTLPETMALRRRLARHRTLAHPPSWHGPCWENGPALQRRRCAVPCAMRPRLPRRGRRRRRRRALSEVAPRLPSSSRWAPRQ